MDDGHRDFAAVPVGDVFAGLQLPDIKALFDTLQVVTEPVGHQNRLTVGGFDDILQSVQLPVVELYRVAGVSIDGTVGKLGQLSGQGRCVSSSHLAVRELKSSKDIADWNSGKIPVAVIHPASAGHGLNLQAGGSTLIWFGLTWSLELYQQTNARLWRQGQSSGTVVIQHIITKGTIDERILKALEAKDRTQAALIDAVKVALEV